MSNESTPHEGPYCEHGYYFADPQRPSPLPCGCRPVACFVCAEQMYYDGDKRYEPEFALTSSTDRTEGYAHKRCIIVPDEIVNEVQRRMDAVVDAAVEWHQDEGEEWSQKAEILGDAIDALLELREPPKETVDE